LEKLTEMRSIHRSHSCMWHAPDPAASEPTTNQGFKILKKKPAVSLIIITFSLACATAHAQFPVTNLPNATANQHRLLQPQSDETPQLKRSPTSYFHCESDKS